MEDITVAAEPTRTKSSGMAMASFIIGMIGYTGLLLDIGFAIWVRSIPDLEVHKTMLIASGGLLLLNTAMILVGLILGIVSLKQKATNRWMAIVGVIMNAVYLGLIALMMIVGFVGMSRRKMPPNTSLEPTAVNTFSSVSRFMPQFGGGSAFGR